MGWIILNRVLLKGSDIQVLYFTGHQLAVTEKAGGNKRKAIRQGVATEGSSAGDASQFTLQDTLPSYDVGF